MKTSTPNCSKPSDLSSIKETRRECEAHGPYVAAVLGIGELQVLGLCPECQREQREAEAAAEVRRQEMDRSQRVKVLLERSQIPERFRDRTLAGYATQNPGQRVALATTRHYADTWPKQLGAGGSLVFTGGPGTGKTHLATAAGNQIMRQHGASCRFGTVVRIIREIKDTYRKDSATTEQAAINSFVAPALLIVDEIGVQLGSEHEKMLLFEILNERYQRLRPTILISNLSGEDLEGFIGQRIMDRYRECGSIVAFDWKSWRGSKA